MLILSRNRTGPIGRPGSAGPQGPAGPQGTVGPQGPGLSGVSYNRWGRTKLLWRCSYSVHR